MKKTFYLLLILALPTMVTAQSTQKKTTATKASTSTEKTTAPAKKPVAQAAMPMPSRISFQTFVTDNQMMLNGDFQVGKDYLVIIMDDKKNILFTANFTAQSNAQNVTLEKPLAKGAYVITMREKNNELASGTINLVLN